MDSRNTVRLHWLEFKFRMDIWSVVVPGVESWFGPLGEERVGRWNVRYDRSRTIELGSGAGYVTYSSDSSVPEVQVMLKGDLLDELSPVDQWEFVRWLYDVGSDLSPEVMCGRYDVAYDDWGWLRTPQAIWGEVCPKRAYGPFRTHCAAEFANGDDTEGFKLSFGKQGMKYGSGAYLCIYDKNVESEGKINACRFEARFFGDRATLQFEDCVRKSASSEEFHRRLGETLGGCISFYAPESMADSHADRRALAPWWASIVAALGSSRVVKRQELADDMDDVQRSFEKQDQAKFAAIFKAIEIRTGSVENAWAWVAGQLDAGERRFAGRWEKLLAKVRRPDPVAQPLLPGLGADVVPF